MKDAKRIVATVSITLALLLISSLFLGFSNPTSSSVPANSVVDASTASPSVNQATDYGDVMDYDWPMLGQNEGYTRFSAGPAPDRPDILWEALGTVHAAFDGKVFVVRGGGFWMPGFPPPPPPVLYALDPFTGEEIWSTPLDYGSPWGPSVTKIDDDYLFVDGGAGIACYRIDNGAYVWNINITGGSVVYEQPSTAGYFPGRFSSELKMKYRAIHDTISLESSIVAYDLSDPLQPATLAWRHICDEPSILLCCGDGKVFLGSFQGFVYALDGKTGTPLWRSPKKGLSGYSAIYTEGRLIHGCASTTLTCYNADTGEILWDKDQGGRAFFSYGGAAGYGRVYHHNIDPYGGFVGCWDVETGEMLWKTDAYYYIAYNCPALADGKLYELRSDGTPIAGRPAEPLSFTCFDAFTGAILWEIPMSVDHPMVAYGNLYLSTFTGMVCFGSKPKDWSVWRGNIDNPGVGQLGPSDISFPKWTYATGGAVTSSPVVVDGKVYIGSNDEYLHCIDAYTGIGIWKFKTNFRIASSPTVVDGKVYIGPDDGNIYCINAETGTEIWKKDAGGLQSHIMVEVSTWQVRSSPIIVDGKLYVGALDGKVYCLDADDGNIEWTYQTEMPIAGSPAYADGTIYIASLDRNVYALDAANGNKIWNWTTPTVIGGWVHMFMVSTPTVADGTVFIGGGGHNLPPAGVIFVALNATTGEEVWNVVTVPVVGWTGDNSNQPYAPTYVDGVLYHPQAMGVAARNATDGSQIWYQWLGFQVFSSVAYADDPRGAKIYVGNDAYAITCLDAASGEPISSYTTKGQIPSSPALYEGKLYVGSRDFNVYCFDDKPTVSTSIWAESSKGAKCWANETVVISGALRAPVTYTYPLDPTITEDYYPPIPNAEILVTFTKPDGTLVNVTATTDEMGLFEASYNPGVAGNWTWTAWYEGKELPHISYSYAYTEDMPLKVVSEEEPTNGEEPPTEGIPTEYIYAIVAVVAIAVIAITGYTYMKRRKK